MYGGGRISKNQRLAASIPGVRAEADVQYLRLWMNQQLEMWLKEPPKMASGWVRGSHGYCGQALVHSDLGLRPRSNLMTLGKSFHLSETGFLYLKVRIITVPTLRPVWW